MNVKIIRVLNTNAVVSVDSQGMELIMTGPGIGFKKRKGENIDQSLVDKTYHLENKEESKRLQEVVKEISEEYLGIADRVVKEAKKEKIMKNTQKSFAKLEFCGTISSMTYECDIT